MSKLNELLADIAAMAEDAEKAALGKACSSFVADGGSTKALADVLIPAGWRFIICGSGTEVTVAKYETLRGLYAHDLELAASWRKLVRVDRHHDRIAIELHDLQAAHVRLSQFMLPGDKGLGDVNEDIDKIFRGTGYAFDGYLMGDDDDFEDVDEMLISVDV